MPIVAFLDVVLASPLLTTMGENTFIYFPEKVVHINPSHFRVCMHTAQCLLDAYVLDLAETLIQSFFENKTFSAVLNSSKSPLQTTLYQQM